MPRVWEGGGAGGTVTQLRVSAHPLGLPASLCLALQGALGTVTLWVLAAPIFLSSDIPYSCPRVRGRWWPQQGNLGAGEGEGTGFLEACVHLCRAPCTSVIGPS